MSNEYYNDTNAPGTLSRGSSTIVRSEFAAVQAGFDKLPPAAALWSNNGNYVAGGGPPDGWTATVAVSYVTGYVDGMQLRVRFPSANALSAPTINVNGLGVRTIVSPSGGLLNPGDIGQGAVVTLTYDAANSRFQSDVSPISNIAALTAAAVQAAANLQSLFNRIYLGGY